jgi:hypothetical protein
MRLSKNDIPVNKPVVTVENIKLVNICKKVCDKLGIDYLMHEYATGNDFYQIDMYVSNVEQAVSLVEALHKLNIVGHHDDSEFWSEVKNSQKTP